MKSTLKPYAQGLRKRLTDTEKVLWKALRAKRFKGLKWKRQEPIGKCIVDFVCYKKRIIVECDGSQHIVELIWKVSSGPLSLTLPRLGGGKKKSKATEVHF